MSLLAASPSFCPFHFLTSSRITKHSQTGQLPIILFLPVLMLLCLICTGHCTLFLSEQCTARVLQLPAKEDINELWLALVATAEENGQTNRQLQHHSPTNEQITNQPMLLKFPPPPPLANEKNWKGKRSKLLKGTEDECNCQFVTYFPCFFSFFACKNWNHLLVFFRLPGIGGGGSLLLLSDKMSFLPWKKGSLRGKKTLSSSAVLLKPSHDLLQPTNQPTDWLTVIGRYRNVVQMAHNAPAAAAAAENQALAICLAILLGSE